MKRTRTAVLLAAARLGNAHWFFGNLYEEVVGMPARLADGHRTGLFGPGSPVRYYVPAAPLTFGATLASVVGGWHRREDRPALAVAGALTAVGAAITGHLVRTVIVRLVGEQLSDAERDRLVAHWHRANRVRLVAAVGAGVALGLVGKRNAPCLTDYPVQAPRARISRITGPLASA